MADALLTLLDKIAATITAAAVAGMPDAEVRFNPFIPKEEMADAGALFVTPAGAAVAETLFAHDTVAQVYRVAIMHFAAGDTEAAVRAGITRLRLVAAVLRGPTLTADGFTFSWIGLEHSSIFESEIFQEDSTYMGAIIALYQSAIDF